MNVKVSRWKILGIVVALVLGYAINSYAYRIQISEDTWADFTIRGQLFYYNWAKRSDEKPPFFSRVPQVEVESVSLLPFLPAPLSLGLLHLSYYIGQKS